MSGNILDHEHIHVLVHAGLKVWPYEVDGSHLPLSWTRDGRREQLTPDNVHQVGQMLVNENHRSHAYAMDPNNPAFFSPVYTYQDPHYTDWQEVEILRAIHGYVWEACDAPDWRDTGACRFCEQLEGRTMQRLPGYDMARTWAITPSTMPITITRPALHLVR